MVPRDLPNPPQIVREMRRLEIAGVIGLIVPETARLAAICLLAPLVTVVPAEVLAARRTVVVGREPATRGPATYGPATPLWFRAIVEVVFIVPCGVVTVAGYVGTSRFDWLDQMG